MHDDYNDVQCFLRCPLHDIKAGKFQSIAKEMQAMLKHIRRHRNEVIIIKCQNENCPHCSQHPIIFQFLKERYMKMFAPLYQALITLATTAHSSKCVTRIMLNYR